jgi:plastocyanin
MRGMRFLMAMGLASVALLAGSATANPLPSFSRKQIVVRMTQDHRFDPQVVTIRPGDTVLWKNEDQSVHSVVGDPFLALHRNDIEPPSPPEPFHSDDLKAGQSYSRAFTIEGVYRYVCLHHEEQGMNGTVIVKPGR